MQQTVQKEQTSFGIATRKLPYLSDNMALLLDDENLVLVVDHDGTDTCKIESIGLPLGRFVSNDLPMNVCGYGGMVEWWSASHLVIMTKSSLAW